MGEVKVKIRGRGELWGMEEKGGGGGNKRGGIVREKMKELMSEKYGGGGMMEWDMEKGMREVEIFEEGGEKDV